MPLLQPSDNPSASSLGEDSSGSNVHATPSGGDEAEAEATYHRVLRSQSDMGDGGARSQPSQHRRASAQLHAWGRDALVKMCQGLSCTLRKLVKLEYVMGKELLRNALHALLEALSEKRLQP